MPASYEIRHFRMKKGGCILISRGSFLRNDIRNRFQIIPPMCAAGVQEGTGEVSPPPPLESSAVVAGFDALSGDSRILNFDEPGLTEARGAIKPISPEGLLYSSDRRGLLRVSAPSWGAGMPHLAAPSQCAINGEALILEYE